MQVCVNNEYIGQCMLAVILEST